MGFVWPSIAPPFEWEHIRAGIKKPEIIRHHTYDGDHLVGMICVPHQARDSVLQPMEPRLDRTALVLRHRRLVYLVAWSHTGSGLEIDDLVQEGMCGLLTAADRYDPGRGVRFWTYARYWVLEAIHNAIFEHSPSAASWKR